MKVTIEPTDGHALRVQVTTADVNGAPLVHTVSVSNEDGLVETCANLTNAINASLAGVESQLDELGYSREERAIRAFLDLDGDEDEQQMIRQAIAESRQPAVGAPTSSSEPATQLEPDEIVS